MRVDRTQKLFFQTFAKNVAVAIFQLSSAATNDRSFNGETNTVSIPMQAVFSIAISKKNLHTAMGQRRHQGNHIPPKPRNSQSLSLCPPLRIHNQKPKIHVTPLAAQSSHTSLILSRDGINLSNIVFNKDLVTQIKLHVVIHLDVPTRKDPIRSTRQKGSAGCFLHLVPGGQKHDS